MPPRSCQRAALAADPELRGLIRYATLAPNGHNAQPWRFRAQDGGIAILPDLTRRTPVVDPDDHHLFVSLGGAAETLAIAAAARGRASEVSFSPENGGAVAVVFGGGRVAEPALFDAIPRRQATAPIMTDGLWWPLIYARLQPPPRCRESISSCSATRRRSNG